MRSACSIIGLAACAPSALPCGEGTKVEDGFCVNVLDPIPSADTDADTDMLVSPSIPALLAQLPPCRRVPGDGRLDLAKGCIDGGCLHMTMYRLEAVWGAPLCVRDDVSSWVCVFQNGQYVTTTDDGAGLPNRLAALNHLNVPPMYHDVSSGLAASGEGLGVGASVRCFIHDLGMPDSVSFDALGLGWHDPTALDWSTGAHSRVLAWAGRDGNVAELFIGIP